MMPETPGRGRVVVGAAVACAVIAGYLAYHAWFRAAPEPAAASLAIGSAEPRPASSPAAASADPEQSLAGSTSSLSGEPQALLLFATAPRGRPTEGTAAIGTDARNPQTYGAGAVLANGAVLREIYPDYVILRHDGVDSILVMRGRKPQLPPAHRSLPAASAAARVGGQAATRALERIPTSREDISELLRAEPLYERDEFAGLKLLPGTDRGRIVQLGLESGDIVRGIEGKRLESPDAAWQLLDDAISTGTPIVISVERGGALTSLTLDGSRIAGPTRPTASF